MWRTFVQECHMNLRMATHDDLADICVLGPM